MSELILRASDLHKSVISGNRELSILSGVNLNLAPAETLAVVGASGSGKTTLLCLLAGLDLPDSGQIHFKGKDLSGLGEDGRARLRASEIGFVFQSFQLLTDLTAQENVALPLELFGFSRPQKTADHWLSLLGLGDRKHHFPHQLSAGEQQRVALCRAFAPKPALLFADEPTANLDQQTADEVVDQLFRHRADSGAAVILVTHDPRLASRCDRTLNLNQGILS